MKTQKWSEIEKKFSPERKARIDKMIQPEQLEISLREMRQMAGETQAEVAMKMDTTPRELSRRGRREDGLLSTLKEYVKALGGELEVIAVFGDKRLRYFLCLLAPRL